MINDNQTHSDMTYQKLLSHTYEQFPKIDKNTLNEIVSNLNPDLENIDLQEFINEVQEVVIDHPMIVPNKPNSMTLHTFVERLKDLEFNVSTSVENSVMEGGFSKNFLYKDEYGQQQIQMDEISVREVFCYNNDHIYYFNGRSGNKVIEIITSGNKYDMEPIYIGTYNEALKYVKDYMRANNYPNRYNIQL